MRCMPTRRFCLPQSRGPLIEKVNDEFHVDEIYMHPTDFSAMK
jgi:hypothetical protein